MSELKRCSKCKCSILLSFFETNRKGIVCKTCIRCQEKRKKKPSEQPVKCDKCDVICSSRGNLTIHTKMVHDKIKDFKCDICEFNCSANGNLQKHIKLCTGGFSGSSGEFKVYKALIELNVQFNREVSVLKNDQGKWLRMDFEVIQDGQKKKYVEYDGRQHFKPVQFSGSTEDAVLAFKKLKLHDALKNKYCEDNGFELLRIKYDQKDEILELISEFLC